MILSIEPDKVLNYNIFFSEKKKNIIIDGDFMKILYSTDYFVMNGVYINTSFNAKKPPGLRISKSHNSIDELSGKARNQFELLREIYPVYPPPENLNKFSTMVNQINIRRAASFENILPILPQTEAILDCSRFANPSSPTKYIGRTPRQEYMQTIFVFDMADINNIHMVSMLCDIESRLIEQYKTTYMLSKTASMNLKTQLSYGTIKVHYKSQFPTQLTNCILKISGIWETED
jgi:hypothetical protein